MDEHSALPPDVPQKTLNRIRTTSLNPRQAFPRSPSTTRAESPSLFTSSTTQNEKLRPELSKIIAPTPQRHLLESSASQHWLRTPPLSPVSSRAASPASTYGHGIPSLSHRGLHHHTSFSTLLQQESSPGAPFGLTGARPKSQEKTDGEASMGRRWIRWMHKRGLKHWVVPGAIIASTLVKSSIGLGSYSGQGAPPMFGDYEAQRHWMELTIHLPRRQWYTYDLLYWGLDYPPLTAYVSWLCGKIGSWIEPSWLALDVSRGIETEGSKIFMRSTVMALDALIYVPALLMFSRTWQGTRSKRTQSLALLTLLFQPALLLIDFGHFQYNSVMLGLTLLAFNCFATGQDLLGAIYFVLSLGFKQMALYYAPAIGTYLVAKCLYLGPSRGRTLFIRLALVTCATFLLLFMPYLPPFASVSAVLDPISRIFPFSRGLFEDKVANFWCASNVLFKWKSWASRGFLVKLSTTLTALGFIPSMLVLLQAGIKHQMSGKGIPQPHLQHNTTHAPFLPLLPYALLNSSMSFFLFSFQVHEKTILLPLLPITLLLSGASVDSPVYSWGALANNVAVFSMWPLLKRDGLGVQYIATILLWNRLIGYSPFRRPTKSFVQFLSMTIHTAAISLHLLEFAVTPPSRYPDLFTVLNVLIATPVFFLTWLWSIKCGIELGWALGGLPGSAKPSTVRKPSDDDEGTANISVGVIGSYRQMGGRAISLGSGQNKKRATYRSSRSSVAGGE